MRQNTSTKMPEFVFSWAATVECGACPLWFVPSETQENSISLLSGCQLETASWLGMGHRVNFLRI